MKLSTLAVTATLAVLSSSVFAKDVVLKPVDQNLETQACYVAATQGISAAKALVKENGQKFSKFASALTCNELNIYSFAKRYNQQKEALSSTPVNKIALVAKNTNPASKLCLDALVIGEEAARDKHDIQESVICNNQSLATFVNSYDNENVEVRITED